jgi:hypothetical protein
MNRPRSQEKKCLLMLALGGCLLCESYAFDLLESNNRGSNQITAVSSKACDDYVRIKLPDGSYQAETFAFGRGGYYSGFRRDETIEQVGFEDVAQTIATQLANQNYLRSKDPDNTKLLIMVYWGTAMAASPNGELGRMQLHRNANLLGYDEDTVTITRVNSVLDWKKRDLIADLEMDRYFIVLMAYDFQLLWKEKKHRLLWETRFSLREIGHDFSKEFPAMAQSASQYFGQNSHGLVRKIVPEGHVDIGEPKSLGEVPEK